VGLLIPSSVMTARGMLAASAFSLFVFVWGVRHADEPRGLFLALSACLALFSVGRD
jgi:hypothetical protein